MRLIVIELFETMEKAEKAFREGGFYKDRRHYSVGEVYDEDGEYIGIGIIEHEFAPITTKEW